MKYLLTPWKAVSGKHEMLVDNKTPTKTTHIRGYGFGVTFSSRCFTWKRNFSGDQEILRFSDAANSL